MRHVSKKQRRLHAIRQLIKDKKVSTQEDLRKELDKMGLDVTQSSLSRDLNSLGVIKRHGLYHFLVEKRSAGLLPPITAITWAGQNILVVKTYSSMAPTMASLIDEQIIPGVIGTVAGDDTVFVATGAVADREGLVRHLRRFFR